MAYAKHNKRVDVIYVDGHAAPSLPSALTWGQFYGKFSGTTDGGYLATQAICQPYFDGQQWSGQPE